MFFIELDDKPGPIGVKSVAPKVASAAQFRKPSSVDFTDKYRDDITYVLAK